MMRTTLFRLAAIFGFVLGALAVGTAAAADNTNPNGALVLDIQNQCWPDSYTGGQYCVTEHAVFTNPSDGTNAAGNASVTVNSRVCYTQTDSTGVVVYQHCTNYDHEHLLFKDGTPQEGHISFSDISTSSFGSVCFTQNYHFANGQVQYGSINPTRSVC